MQGFKKQLERHLEGEVLLYKSYLEELSHQRDGIRTFQLKGFEERTKKVQALCQQMEKAAVTRQEMIAKQHPQYATSKLTDLIQKEYSSERALLSSSKTLKQLAEQARKESHEFSQVTNFALNMIHGGLSLIWSATQNVTKRYGPQGEVTEAVTPNKSRKETLLKQL